MEPACFDCAHLFVHTGSGLMAPDLITCTAFYPAPIPDDILVGHILHDVPHPDQQNRDVLFLSTAPNKAPAKK